MTMQDNQWKASPSVGDATASIEAVKDGAGKLVDTAGSLVGQAQEVASDVGKEAQEAIANLAQTQKQSGAQLLQTISKAAEAAATELEKTSPEIAGYVREAADGLDRYGQDFENQSVSQLMQTFTGFAKREPTVLLAGSVIAGFLLTRFIKSSGSVGSQSQTEPGLSTLGTVGQNSGMTGRV